ncbi:MAG TPA: hypothetical protein VG821_02475 [Rhizomicrobium sp.]|jgi:hypothetical protein|nr:hypothetical protein [Rhizomicrobium sp.]
MKKFAADLADFLRRHYPDASHDGWYRFSADIQIRDGEVNVEVPILTRMPDGKLDVCDKHSIKSDPVLGLPRAGA